MEHTSVFSEQLVEKLMESSRSGTIRSFLRRAFSQYLILFDLMSFFVVTGFFFDEYTSV